MIPRDVILSRIRHRFSAEDSGASLVEFSLVIALVLVLFFAILDFGRIGYAFVAGQKAVQNAARLAVVSPPVCSLPSSTHLLDPSQFNADPPWEFGTQCSAADPSPCVAGQPVSCLGAGTVATSIHASVRALLPPSAGVNSLRYTYSFDPRLGFLGGPYTPMVTVELIDSQAPQQGTWIPMISPLGPLLQLVGGATGSQLFQDGRFTLPVLSVSMPGESLE
jgi:hypothetical protein